MGVPGIGSLPQRTRTILFFTVCAVVRAALAAAALLVRPVAPRLVLAAGLGTIGAGFVYQTLNGRGTGAFGGPAFWKPLRPVHALAYGGAAVAVGLGQHELAAALLVGDLVLGSGAVALDRFNFT